jgi:zona occludens toxin (predicted ATPase)
MLKIITGKPGSGKTYYAIKELLNNCDYDPIAGVYDTKPGIQLITSIDNVQFNARNFDQELKGKTLEQFFDVEHWEQYTKQYKKVVIVIDEAQRYFPSKARDIPNSVFFWFEYHRHFGMDVILITQDPWSIHRRILTLAENYIEAQPASMRIKNNLFKYKRRCTTTNEVLSNEFIKTDDKVFAAYRSATHKEGIKKQPGALKFYYAAILGIAVVFSLSLYGFVKAYQGHMGGGAAVAQNEPKVDGPVVVQKKPAKEKLRTPPAIIEKVVDLVTNELDEARLMKWTMKGVPEDDYNLIPSACDLITGYVRCPPYTLPVSAKHRTMNNICSGSGSGKTCYLYFPLEKST